MIIKKEKSEGEKKDKIIHEDINKEMRSAYLNYSMSVITARALPDVRDGLKPVHRRILFSMNDMGIHANTKQLRLAQLSTHVLWLFVIDNCSGRKIWSLYYFQQILICCFSVFYYI